MLGNFFLRKKPGFHAAHRVNKEPLSRQFGFNPFCERRNGNFYFKPLNDYFNSDAAHGLFFGSSLRISIFPVQLSSFAVWHIVA